MDIKESIFHALEISYNEAQIFKLDDNGQTFSLPEYFLTVNMCKELLKWQRSQKGYFKIEAEKKTSELYSGCFNNWTLENEDDIFSEMIFSSNTDEYHTFKSEIRKGKVDIALTSEGRGFDTISDYVIEIKAINPSKIKLLADFYRISSFLRAEIPAFDNLMKKGFLTFIKHHNSKKDIQSDEEFVKLKTNYIERLKKNIMSGCPENIGFKIYDKKIGKCSLGDLREDMSDNYSENAGRTFMAYSIIIEVFKKNISIS